MRLILELFNSQFYYHVMCAHYFIFELSLFSSGHHLVACMLGWFSSWPHLSFTFYSLYWDSLEGSKYSYLANKTYVEVFWSLQLFVIHFECGRQEGTNKSYYWVTDKDSSSVLFPMGETSVGRPMLYLLEQVYYSLYRFLVELDNLNCGDKKIKLNQLNQLKLWR
jgi:hypothetical protein